MKSLLTFFLAICTCVFQDLASVRQHYIAAADSQKKAEEFYDLLANASKENKVLQAYKGASIALKAKFAKDRKAKKALFVEGVKLIEATIKTDASSVELRLIRLSIQENTPKILNYKSNITDDKRLILANFAKQNQALREYIQSYVRQSSVFTESEKKSILN